MTLLTQVLGGECNVGLGPLLMLSSVLSDPSDRCRPCPPLSLPFTCRGVASYYFGWGKFIDYNLQNEMPFAKKMEICTLALEKSHVSFLTSEKQSENKTPNQFY